MRIGVVSDTHNNLKNVRRIVELFNQTAVERVVHTGDITQAKTVAAFAELSAPLYGVFGNNDQGELADLSRMVAALGFHFVQPPLALEWAQRRIVVVHDPLELASVDPGEYDLILHGHTHLETIEYNAARLTFNPGESAGMMPGANAIGIVDLNSLSADIIKF
ncbi:MAG: YfcE family phosphodiesterase [Pseudomonadales bacterium]